MNPTDKTYIDKLCAFHGVDRIILKYSRLREWHAIHKDEEKVSKYSRFLVYLYDAAPQLRLK